MKNDFGLDLGHRFQLRGDWGHVDCEILDVEPGRTLSYAWNTAHDDPAYALDSVVTFTLEPTPAGTLLRMEQVGFRPDQKQAFGGAKGGWRTHLDNLEQGVAGLDQGIKIGRASCRERVRWYVEISVVAVPYKKTQHK